MMWKLTCTLLSSGKSFLTICTSVSKDVITPLLNTSTCVSSDVTKSLFFGFSASPREITSALKQPNTPSFKHQ